MRLTTYTDYTLTNLVAPKRELIALLAVPAPIGLETITHSQVKT